jgi:hypothetical protein
MSVREWAYTIVPAALSLQDLPGERPSARIDFEQPEELWNSFCIELWLRPQAYPQDGATPVLRASLLRHDGEPRDLVLRLDGQHMTTEFQDFHGPLADPPPRDRWTHVALLYEAGRLQVIYWRQGEKPFDDSVQLEDESYHLQSIVLASENGASLLFAELRLWKRARDTQAIEADRGRPIDRVDDELLGYWRLDEGAGTVLIDSTARNNHGVVEGGSYLADSGLSLRIGEIVTNPDDRTYSTDGRTYTQPGRQARWKGDSPAVLQHRYLDALEPDKNSSAAAEHEAATARMEQLDTQLAALNGELDANEAAYRDEQLSFEQAWKQKNKEVDRERAEWDRKRRETLADLEQFDASQKVHLKELIVRLQENLTWGREHIREYGRVVGLDSVSMDLKVLFSLGGNGLHLPDPGEITDPGRLSTVKLRFRAAPPEELEEAKLTLAPVPALEGNTEEFGRRKLAQAGFRVNVVYQEVTDATQDGRILAQLYNAHDGNRAPLASSVTLVVGARQ